MTILKFAGYDFGALIEDFDTNFGEGAPETRRLPGVDGGWSDLGDDAAPTPPGRVTFAFWLVADDRDEMDAKRNAVRALANLGLRRLEYTSLDEQIGTLYCYARAISPRLPEQKHRHTDLHQRVQMVFEVPDARWRQDKYTSWRLDGGFDLDDGKTVGEGALELAASGSSSVFTVTHDGNAVSVPAISIMPGEEESCQNPKVQRIRNGLIVDEVAYTGTLDAGNELFMDGKRQYAALNADSVFGNGFRYRHPALFRLEPGSNTVRVVFANAEDAATVRFWFQSVYR